MLKARERRANEEEERDNWEEKEKEERSALETERRCGGGCCWRGSPGSATAPSEGG